MMQEVWYFPSEMLQSLQHLKLIEVYFAFSHFSLLFFIYFSNTCEAQKAAFFEFLYLLNILYTHNDS